MNKLQQTQLIRPRSIFFGGFLCLACLFAPATSRGAQPMDSEVLAAVEKNVITRHDLKFYLLEIRLRREGLWAVPDDVLEQDLLTEAVHSQLLYDEFWKPGTEPPEAAIKEATSEAWKHLAYLAGSQQKLEAAIKRSGLGAQQVREWLEEQAKRQWIIEGEINARLDPALFNQQDVSPGEAEKVHLASIFTNTVDSSSEESWNKARERALFIRSEIEEGLVFEQAARLYSDDKSAARSGGDLGWIDPQHLEPQIREAIDQLSPGEVTNPQRGRGGWYLFRLIDYDTERRSTLRKLKRDERRAVLERLREEAEILLSSGYELQPLE